MADVHNFNANGNVHKIPEGFTKPAGRLVDGQFYGRFSQPSQVTQFDITTSYGTIDVFVRTFKGFSKPIAEVKQYGPNNPPASVSQVVKDGGFLVNFCGGYTDQFKTLLDFAGKVASASDLATLGTGVNQLLPIPATKMPIPFQVDDNGYLKPYVEATDPADPLKTLAEQQKSFLETITASVTGQGTAGGGASGAGTGLNANLTKYLRIAGTVLGIAAGVAIIIVIFRAVSK